MRRDLVKLGGKCLGRVKPFNSLPIWNTTMGSILNLTLSRNSLSALNWATSSVFAWTAV